MPVLFYIGNDHRPYKGYAPHTFPRGEGGTAIAVTDEECGR